MPPILNPAGGPRGRTPTCRPALWALSVAALAVSACDSGGPSGRDLTGRWLGLGSAQVCQDGDLDLDLVFGDDGTVSGSGTAKRWSGQCGSHTIRTFYVDVQGTYDIEGSGRLTLRSASGVEGSMVFEIAACAPNYLSCEASLTGGVGRNDSFTFFRTSEG